MKVVYFARKCFMGSMAILALGTSCAFASHGDWLVEGQGINGRGNQQSEHKISPCNVHNLVQSWFLPGAAVEKSAQALHKNVYYGDFDGNAYSVKAKDGSLNWSQNFPGTSIEGSFAVTDKAVYVPAYDTSGSGNAYIIALDRKTGAIIFKSPLEATPPPQFSNITSPIVVDDLVLIGSTSGQSQEPGPYTFRGALYAFNKHTGAFVWRYVYQPNSDAGAGGSTSVSLAADPKRGYVFVGSGNAYNPPSGPYTASLLCLNYKTKDPNGELVWSRQLSDDSLFSYDYPVALDFDVGAYPQLFSIKEDKKKDRDVVGIGDKKRFYYVLDRDSGKQIWKKHLIPHGETPAISGSPSAAYADGLIFAPAMYDPLNLLTPDVVLNPGQGSNFLTILTGFTQEYKTTITALKADSGKIKWQRTFDGALFGNVTHANGVVYTTHFNGYLRALDAKTGKTLYEFLSPTAAGPFGQPPFNLNIPLASAIISKGKLYVSGGYNIIPGGLFRFELAP